MFSFTFESPKSALPNPVFGATSGATRFLEKRTLGTISVVLPCLNEPYAEKTVLKFCDRTPQEAGRKAEWSERKLIEQCSLRSTVLFPSRCSKKGLDIMRADIDFTLQVYTRRTRRGCTKFNTTSSHHKLSHTQLSFVFLCWYNWGLHRTATSGSASVRNILPESNIESTSLLWVFFHMFFRMWCGHWPETL